MGPESVEEEALPATVTKRSRAAPSGPPSFAAALEACPPSGDYVELLKKEVCVLERMAWGAGTIVDSRCSHFAAALGRPFFFNESFSSPYTDGKPKRLGSQRKPSKTRQLVRNGSCGGKL